MVDGTLCGAQHLDPPSTSTLRTCIEKSCLTTLANPSRSDRARETHTHTLIRFDVLLLFTSFLPHFPLVLVADYCDEFTHALFGILLIDILRPKSTTRDRGVVYGHWTLDQRSKVSSPLGFMFDIYAVHDYLVFIIDIIIFHHGSTTTTYELGIVSWIDSGNTTSTSLTIRTPTIPYHTTIDPL